MICGIDEAGRGPVLGCLVVAGLKCAKGEEKQLRELGVKDSKKLSPKKREELYAALTSSFKYHVIKIHPAELNASKLTLNALEGIKFAEVINALKPATAYIDCADVEPENFQEHITKCLACACELVIEHKADDKYPVVSAASIIAKVERDREIEKLRDTFGDLGSGYPSDPKTIAFLEAWYKKNGSFPPFARKKWKTLGRLKNSKLDSF